MVFIFLNIFLGALLANSIAPLMPVFQEKLNATVAFSTFIPVVNTAGTTIFSFIISFFINKLGLKKTHFIGHLFLLSSLLILSFLESLKFILLGVFLLGSGLSIIFTSSTTFLSHFKDPKFGIVHGFFGLGGILSPMFVSLFLKSGISYKYLYLIYLSFVIFLFIWNMNMKFPDIKIDENSFSSSKPYLKPLFYITVLSLFFYSASEISTATWAPNLFLNFGFTKQQAALFLSIFWGLFTFSRFLMDFLLKFVNYRLYVLTITSLSFIFLSLLIVLKIPFLFYLFGLSMGAIFPLIQRNANIKLDKSEVGFLNGITYSATGIGSLLFISLMGYISKFSIRAMFVVPIIGLAVVFLLQKNLRE
ncbi:MAG: hypothetical protein PWQ45_968 [Thermosipho sp. (in: thermotogales)]|nr:hypothetical protein [Thermosipho sp. (in: thermotogales)]